MLTIKVRSKDKEGSTSVSEIPWL